MEYKKLDKEILEHKNCRIASSVEALKNVISMQWFDEVINGFKKVIIGKYNLK